MATVAGLVGDPLDYPIGYRGLTLNDHRTSAGLMDNTLLLSNYLVERFDFSRLRLRDQREGLHLMSGADLGSGTKQERFITLMGRLKDTTAAKLEDRVSALLQAFDIEEAQYASPTTEGVNVLDFYTPTEYSGTGIASPVREMFRGRPSVNPQVFERRGGSLSRMFAVELVCPDPRRYLYTRTTVTPNSGNGWSIAAPNWNANMGAMTYGIITVVLSGAGHASMTFTLTPTTVGSATSLVCDFSTETSGTFYILMEKGLILKGGTVDLSTGAISGGTKKAYIRTSNVDTCWGIPRNGGTFAVTNRTAVTSVSLDYHQARA